MPITLHITQHLTFPREIKKQKPPFLLCSNVCPTPSGGGDGGNLFSGFTPHSIGVLLCGQTTAHREALFV
ncbi:hypothetical protein RP20_CCG027210 [Aedes albopictus]|nr:hypothetical protein RP20_CCG027210 [Aedes albopictus]